jgi:hypothetical protein
LVQIRFLQCFLSGTKAEMASAAICRPSPESTLLLSGRAGMQPDPKANFADVLQRITCVKQANQQLTSRLVKRAACVSQVASVADTSSGQMLPQQEACATSATDLATTDSIIETLTPKLVATTEELARSQARVVFWETVQQSSNAPPSDSIDSALDNARAQIRAEMKVEVDKKDREILHLRKMLDSLRNATDCQGSLESLGLGSIPKAGDADVHIQQMTEKVLTPISGAADRKSAPDSCCSDGLQKVLYMLGLHK